MPLQKLVVDANAFIKGYALQEFCLRVYTVPEVMREIRDSATRQRLKCIPYELILLEPRQDYVSRATEFSKVTGDYASLSLVDIKLIGLALQLQEELEPVTFKETAAAKTVFGSGETGPRPPPTLPMGFHMPLRDLRNYEAHLATRSYVSGYCFSVKDQELLTKLSGLSIPSDFPHLARWMSHIKALESTGCKPSTSKTHVEQKTLKESEGESDAGGSKSAKDSGCEQSEESDEDSEEDSEEDSDDDGGWITPSNYKAKSKDIPTSPLAVLSTDFAIQNVILHTNIPLMSGTGQRIQSLRSYILRCYACFNTTSNFEKKFCPRCGNSTLRKVSVSVGEDGQMKLHFSRKFQLSGRGKKFSLPKPQGGRHAINPLLTEDQQIPQERRSKKAISRESGPFEMNDVNSRSFLVKSSGTHYWDARNPNQVKGKGRKKAN